MNHIKVTLYTLTLLLLSVGCRRTDVDVYGGVDPLPSEVRISFSLLGSSQSNMEVSGLRSIAGLPDDPNQDPYIKTLWALIYNSDGTQYLPPKKIETEDMLADNATQWIFPHDMNYGDLYHVYFITNPEDAGIHPNTFTTEQTLKDYKWDVSAYKDKIYTMNTLPQVRMLVAGYEIGIKSKVEGGKVFGKRISPCGYEDTAPKYAVLHATTNRAVLEVELVRTYSKIHVTMTKDPEKEEKQKEIFKEAYGQTNDIFTTFSLDGYAKKISLFGKTPKPEHPEDKVTDRNFKVKLSGDQRDDLIEWEDVKDSKLKTAELTFYFPAVSQESEEKTDVKDVIDNEGNPLKSVVTYKLPCLRISYRHGEKDLEVFVNATNGEVFKPNCNYNLPITFYPDVQNIWLVRMRNVTEDEGPNIRISDLDEKKWVARTFANELEYGDPKEYTMLFAQTDDGKLYSNSRIFYGNIHAYSTVIETLTVGGPAFVVDKDNLPKWVKSIEQIDKRVFNNQSTLVYRQLWLLNPQEFPDDDTLLRADIRFRNKYNPEKDDNDVIVHASFNVLARVALLNLGELNTFADGSRMEYDPNTNKLLIKPANILNFGKIYQWGRNIPIDFTNDYRYQGNTRGIDTKAALQAPVKLDDLDTPNAADRPNLRHVWTKNTASVNGKQLTYLLIEAKSYDKKYQELKDGKRWTDSYPSTEPKPDEEYLKYPRGLGWFDLSENQDLIQATNQWAWIVRRTYDKYKDLDPSGLESYLGNNNGDPCPGGKERKYYYLPSNKDFGYIFYNEIVENTSTKRVMTQLIDDHNVREKGMNPGGDPSMAGREMQAYYKRVNQKVYSIRFIGTKFQSFFVYEDIAESGRGGLKVSAALTPAGKSLDELKRMVDSGSVDMTSDNKEVRTRIFPYGGVTSIANKWTLSKKNTPYWHFWNYDYYADLHPGSSGVKTNDNSKWKGKVVRGYNGTNEENIRESYADYHLNTLRWNGYQYVEFDFDIHASPIKEKVNDINPLVMPPPTLAAPIRCVRL